MEAYEKICEIGRGSFGSVYKIKRKSDGRILCYKELHYGKMGDKEKQQIVSEVNILRELRHCNIVRYYDRIIDKEKAKIYIVMEYCENGDMAKIIKNSKRKKDYILEDVIWKIAYQMTYALSECHTRKGGKILHRDLKPGNVFLDKNNNIKIGDFGLSRVMGQESIYAYTRVGTPYYMSPEQINGKKYDDKSDIWSLGCVIYEIAALRPPFTADNQLALARKIKEGKIEDLPEQYSTDLQKFISRMINVDPNKRPSIYELLGIPQISLRLREKKIKDSHLILKKKEVDIKRREDEVKKYEEELSERENKIERRTKELEEMEARLNHLQSSLRESNSLISYNNDKYITFQKSDNHNHEESKEPFYENIRHQSIENSMEMGGVNTSRDIMYS